MDIRGRYHFLTLVVYLLLEGGDAEDVCKGKDTGTLLPDPRTCYSYIQCVHGRSVTMPCPNNQFFNPTISVCDHQVNVACPGNRCKKNNGGCEQDCVYIDNNSYGCVCRSGYKMDMDRKTCIQGSADMETYCVNRHDEQLHDPLKCDGFIKCQGDKSVLFPCPSGLTYNREAKVCDFKRTGLCPDEDFEAWGEWSDCTMPEDKEVCIRQRKRNCKQGGIYCKGFDSQVETCEMSKCATIPEADPCFLQNGGCSDICTVKNGVAVCSCEPGRSLSSDKKSCSSETCGIAPLRNDNMIAHIVDGQRARRGAYPWQAAIYYNEKEEDGTMKEVFLCGGTLVAKRRIISAAHCFSGGNLAAEIGQYKVVLGENDRSRDEGTEQRLDVKSITVHEKFDMRTKQNDIALLILSKDASYSNYIKPACLPTENEELKVKTSCRISGWGKQFHVRNVVDVLQEITVPVVAYSVCKAQNSGIKPVTSDMMCTGFDDGTWKSACHGDSGGPLSCMSDSGVWKVYGVVSWGDSQCSGLTAYNVFTKVSHYTKWILES